MYVPGNIGLSRMYKLLFLFTKHYRGLNDLCNIWSFFNISNLSGEFPKYACLGYVDTLSNYHV